MSIRPASMNDIEDIKSIFAYARAFMKKSGNPNQWKDDRPSIHFVENDIKLNRFYIVENEGEIAGCFAFIVGKDPTYEIIEDGKWLNDCEYGTIHRIAGNGTSKGIFEEVLAFCLSMVNNIRIDTHSDNLIMRHLLKKKGFEYCGIIYTDDDTARMAFQLACES